MPGAWLNIAQDLPGGEFILVPSFEQFPLVVLSTTPLMEANLGPLEDESEIAANLDRAAMGVE